MVRSYWTAVTVSGGRRRARCVRERAVTTGVEWSRGDREVPFELRDHTIGQFVGSPSNGFTRLRPRVQIPQRPPCSSW
jgi:hypothetical protein